MKFVVVLLFLAAAVVSGRRYDGYRVIEAGPLKNEQEMKLILNLVDDDERIREVIMLNDNVAKTSPVSLAVAPRVWNRVQEILDENEIHFVVTNNDLQASFDKSMEENNLKLAQMAEKFKKNPRAFAHDAYLPYNDQVALLDAMIADSAIAESLDIGSSYNGQRIRGIAINRGNNNLPAIWIDSNIHAREWISSATVLYIIDEILFGTSLDAQYLRNSFRWFIIPCLNPDGYSWTWTNDRLWRKTRSANAGSICIGTDPNRNWDAHFGGEGASPMPCSDTYHGPYAFSESETAAASEFLKTISTISNVFFSIHCYSNFWLVPYGGTVQKPDNYAESMRVGRAAAEAIKSVNGLDFAVGTPPDLLYVASGGSFDWALDTNNMAYAYSPELRPATQAQGGFDIPATNIIPSGREIFAALVVTVREAVHKI